VLETEHSAPSGRMFTDAPAANDADAVTALVVAVIGLIGVGVGGVGNYLIQSHMRDRAEARAAAGELVSTRAAALALGEALARAATFAARMEHTRFLVPSPHWLQSAEQDWQLKRELLARHVSAEAFLRIAQGFTAADEIERQAMFRRSFWRPVGRIPIISAFLADALRERMAAVYRDRGDRIVLAANLLVAFGVGIDIGSGTPAEMEAIMQSERVPSQAFLRRRSGPAID
jgi:hypothetical protein